MRRDPRDSYASGSWLLVVRAEGPAVAPAMLPRCGTRLQQAAAAAWGQPAAHCRACSWVPCPGVGQGAELLPGAASAGLTALLARQAAAGVDPTAWLLSRNGRWKPAGRSGQMVPFLWGLHVRGMLITCLVMLLQVLLGGFKPIRVNMAATPCVQVMRKCMLVQVSGGHDRADCCGCGAPGVHVVGGCYAARRFLSGRVFRVFTDS
eukprot:jgi/Ulvmu1/8218/UM041_0027.1